MTHLNRNNLFLTSAMVSAVALMRMPATFEGEATAFDFPEVVDDINTVPERARGLYTQDDATKKYKYTDVGGLKASLAATRTERDNANKEARTAAGWKALGKSPEEIKALMEADAARAEAKAREEGEWDSLKKQMEENHTAALSEKDKRIAKLEGSLKSTTIDAGLTSVLADDEIQGNPRFLMPHLRDRVKLEETDEGFRPVVMRSDGTPMLNSQNQPATLKDLALEFKQDENWADAFKGLNQSGGGGTGGSDRNNGGGTTGGGTKKRSEMGNMEKVNYIRQHGQAGYEKLPA